MAGDKRTQVRMPKLEVEVIEINDDSGPSHISEQQMGSPSTPILSLKNKEQIKLFEDKEDCFILEFDPYESVDVLKLEGPDNANDSELCVLSEKGEVACRDFPHPRHTCVKYPFEKTPHENRCEMCYCYVCDTAAPCPKWTGSSGHCHAFNNEAWERGKRIKKQKAKQSIFIVID